MKEWKTLSKELVFEDEKFLKVENHKVELHDGRIIDNWSWVITPDFVNVVAITDDGKYLCFRQTKYAVNGISIAPVGGYIEPNEKPIDAAKRELLEETGYAANEWIELGNFVVDANRGCGNGFLFLSKSIYKISEPKKDDLEEQKMVFLTRKEIESALAKNEIKVFSWAFAFTRSLLIK